MTSEQFGGVATVLFSLLSCSPLFQLLREIQFPNGPQAGSDKRILYNSTQLPGIKNLQQHQQKTSLVQHQLNIYNYKTKVASREKNVLIFLIYFALLAVIFYLFFSKFALRVQTKTRDHINCNVNFSLNTKQLTAKKSDEVVCPGERRPLLPVQLVGLGWSRIVCHTRRVSPRP